MVLKLNKHKAFTLAETMIVILILSILSAAFLPVMTKRLVSKKTTDNGIWSLVGGVGPDIFFKDGIDGGGASSAAGAIIGTSSFAAGDPKTKLMLNSFDDSQYHLLFKQGGISVGRLTMDTKGNIGLGDVTFDTVKTIAPAISNATAIGSGAIASANNSTAFGQGAQASALSSTAFGSGAATADANGTTVGTALGDVRVNYSTSVGHGATASGADGVAIGAVATASGGESVAIGNHSRAIGSGSIAIGDETVSNGLSSIAIGVGAIANQYKSTTIGNYHAPGGSATANQVFLNADVYVSSLTAVDTVNGKMGQYKGGYLSFGNNAGACPATCLFVPSDRRLKNIYGEFDQGLDKVNKLKPYNYSFKNDKEKKSEVGVMAQDLRKVFPHAVIKASDGYLMIREEDMFYSVLNSIKQLYEITQVLAKEIKSLSASAQRVFDKIAILTKNDQLNSQKIKKLESKNKLIKLRLKKLEQELNV